MAYGHNKLLWPLAVKNIWPEGEEALVFALPVMQWSTVLAAVPGSAAGERCPRQAEMLIYYCPRQLACGMHHISSLTGMRNRPHVMRNLKFHTDKILL